jgi:hypothetical protein
MTIEQKDVVDMIGTDPASQIAVLGLIDTRDWGDTVGHLRVLQDKLNHYIHFVSTGQLHNHCSSAISGQPVGVHVYFTHEPPEEALLFFIKAKQRCAELDPPLLLKQETIKEGEPAPERYGFAAR